MIDKESTLQERLEKNPNLMFGSLSADSLSSDKYLELVTASEKRFRTLYENITDGVIIIDDDYVIKDVNDRTCEVSGFTREELIGHQCDILCPKASASKECPIWEKNQTGFTGMDTTLKCANGTRNPILKNARTIDIDGKTYICESFSDISYLKDIELQLRKSNHELKSIVESAPIGISLIRDHKIIECNNQLGDMLGYSTTEMLGKESTVFYKDALVLAERLVASNTMISSQELHLSHKNGSEVIVIATINIFEKEDETSPADVLVTMLDITERHKIREKIWHQAYYDKLTDLPNRAHILKELRRCIDTEEHISLILFDLNKFKEINDNYGHLAGDELLKNVADNLSSFIKAPNFTGRLGGDEFIIIAHTRDREELEEFCTQICELISERCILTNQTIRVSASLGIVSNADNINDYLLRADLAMYEAKIMSKMRPHGAYKFFTPSMLKSHEIQSQMKNMLLEAFNNNEFGIAYQPVYNIKTMSIEGVEALLRWFHPTYGPVAPEVVIPIADETGVLIPIGHWIIDEVGKTLQNLQKQVPELVNTGFYISINMTLQQLSDPDLIRVFTNMLEKYNIPGDIIMIDITDTSALDKSKWSLSIINQLKEYGVRISIDDFGIGYSALSTVERSSINILKLDRSYISKLHIERNMEITKAIINLAKALNLDVVAEGIENLQQFKMVRDLKCDAAQGFYLNKPLDTRELHELIYNLYL